MYVRVAGALLIILVLRPSPVLAQAEDLEPLIVGDAGVTSVGVAGFIDRLMSREEVFPWTATLHLDLARFVTDRIAVRGGLIGSTRFGGDADEDATETGPRARSLQALGSVLYFFTPRSMASFYAGGEYRAQLTDRAERDAGSVLGKGGIQAALSSRVAVFVEGGYGLRLTRGPDDERQTRIAGEVGLRIRF